MRCSRDARNWSVPQVVQIQAALDADGNDDTATLSVSSSGLTSQAVGLAVTDNASVSVAAAVPAFSPRQVAWLAIAMLGAGTLALRRGRSTLRQAV